MEETKSENALYLINEKMKLAISGSFITKRLRSGLAHFSRAPTHQVARFRRVW